MSLNEEERKAVVALLIHDGHKSTTHRGMIAMFGMHYIKTGIFSIEHGRMYSRLESIRDEADYNCSFTACREDIEPYIAQVEAFVAKIRERLTLLDQSSDPESV